MTDRKLLLWTVLTLAVVLGVCYLSSEPVVDERARMDWRLRCR